MKDIKGHINMKVLLLQNFKCCTNQKNNHNKLYKFIRVMHMHVAKCT